MYQQHGISWPGLLREPRVGIGALTFGMAAAFVAGGIVVSIIAGSLPVPPAAVANGTQNHIVGSGRAPLTPGLNVGDFAPVPVARIESVVRLPGLNVGDFAPVPVARIESVVRLPGLNVGD